MSNEMPLMINEGMELGKIFAESGVFPDIKSASQGYIKILAGRELGLSPMQSLNSFYFVNGKLGITANTIAALIKNSKKYDYRIKIHTEQECVIEFISIDDAVIGESAFSIKDAARAGIVNGVNWKNYPKNMLFCRALMNGARWHCADVMSSFNVSIEELYDVTPEKTIKTVEIAENGEVTNGSNVTTKEVETTVSK